MRHKSGPAFFNALAVQRRRMQQGFRSHLEGDGPQEGGTESGNAVVEVSELTVFLEGPHGAGVEPTGE